jgi:methionyl-tRNA synthetase
MISRYCDGRMPAASKGDFDTALENALWKETVEVAGVMGTMIGEMKLDASVAAVMAVVRKINVYLQERAPWSLAREEGTEDQIAYCLYTAAECLRVCAALLYPVMPEKMMALRKALGMTDARPHLGKLTEFGVLISGSEVSQPGALFPRIEQEEKNGKTASESSKGRDRARPSKKKTGATASPPSAEGLITFDQVMAVNLKTAVVLEASTIEGADKLLRLQVDLGGEQRQLVAGIALHYRPDQLVGKTVVVVANLRPAKLRGVESQGMLLAASDGNILKLVTIDGEIGPGAAVK